MLAVLTREVKTRRESIDAFRKGGREDLAAKEEAEIAILADYLPRVLERRLVMIMNGRASLRLPSAGLLALALLAAATLPAWATGTSDDSQQQTQAPQQIQVIKKTQPEQAKSSRWSSLCPR